MRKSIQDSTEGAANKFLRGFDLLKEEVEEFRGKLGIKNGEQHSNLRKIGQFISIKNSCRSSIGKRNQKYFF